MSSGNEEIKEKSKEYDLGLDIEYPFADWKKDFDSRFPVRHCPRCGAKQCVGHIRPDGRKYRSCKVCGLWQEADGVAYECKIVGHICDSGGTEVKWTFPWKENPQCKKCGERYKRVETTYQMLKQ